MNNQFNKETIGNKISDFQNLGVLGKGQFGAVLKMKSNINGQIYAVKWVELPKDENDLKNLIREQYIMNKISHPNIVTLYKTFEDEKYSYFVSEFIDGINLDKYIKNFHINNPNKHIEQHLVINIFQQILSGLQYLHNNHIIHRDIKPDNILIDYNNNIKITDFGISAIYKNGYGILSCHCTRVGRPDYVCPEIINNVPYDYKCDIFSLGYTIYYMMNFHLPTITKIDVNEKVKRIDSDKKVDIYYDIRLIQLVEKMYSYDPEERPGTTQILNILENIKNKNNNINIKNLEYFSKVYYNTNNINNNKTNISSTNLNMDENKILSSMNCILHFLYTVDNMHFIKTMILNNLNNIKYNNSFFPLLLFNALNIIGKKNNNEISNDIYNNNIKIFINQLMNKKIEIEGCRPIVLYYNILYNFKEEFNSLISWTNKLEMSQFFIPNDLPTSKFPEVYNLINDFIRFYKCPLVDIFYFILLNFIKCPNCNSIFKANAQIASMLILLNNQQNSIKNLIGNFLNKKLINEFINCNFCGYKGKACEEKAFFNSPDYLVLDLDEGEKVIFDEEINISQYIKTNLGPKRYSLYAVINKEKDFNNRSQFIASIKEGNNWAFFSGNTKQYCGTESLNVGIPSCAIYKKII